MNSAENLTLSMTRFGRIYSHARPHICPDPEGPRAPLQVADRVSVGATKGPICAA